MTKPRLYLAGPLFSEAERQFNMELKAKLKTWFDIYLPQEDGFLITDLIEEGFSNDAAKAVIFKRDVNEVIGCDVLLVVLDGRVVDEGAAFELGLGFAMGKECIGLQTDFRRLASFGNNPMVDCSLSHTFLDVASLCRWAETRHEAKKKVSQYESAGLPVLEHRHNGLLSSQ